jgi:uroporphyrin-3 C-methyltransferase
MSELDKSQQQSQTSKSVVESPIIDDNTDENDVNSQRSNKKEAKKQRNVVAWLALLLALIALGCMAGAYWYWQKSQTGQQQQVQQWQDQQNTQFAQLKQQISAQQQQLVTQLGSAKSEQNKAQVDLKDQVISMVNVMDGRVAEISGRQPNDWALAEANYLIRIAGRKLWLEDDTQTAQSLLATASVRIGELGDPSLFPLQRTISEDIAAIRALPTANIADIHLSLSGLINELETLPINLIEDNSVKPPEPTDFSLSSESADWQENLTKSFKGFVSDLLFVSPGVAENEVMPFMMPEQQWFLRANVKMAMLQAQIAVLQGKQQVFDDAVKRSLNGLQYFNQADSSVKAVILTLSSVSKNLIQTQYPEHFASQKLIDNLLIQRLGGAYQAPIEQEQPILPQPSVEQTNGGEL